MGLDIRVPVGLILLIIGLLMVIYGIGTLHSVIYARSMEMNLNILWGSVMAVVGAVIFIAGCCRQR
jgi:hypothetical protein